jgi:hypothetical protein
MPTIEPRKSTVNTKAASRLLSNKRVTRFSKESPRTRCAVPQAPGADAEPDDSDEGEEAEDESGRDEESVVRCAAPAPTRPVARPRRAR